MWEADGAGLIQPGAETVSNLSRSFRSAFCSGIWQGMRQGAQVAIREVQAGYQEKHLHHEDGQVVNQIAQRGHEGACFLFYYSLEQEDPGSGAGCSRIRDQGWCATNCVMHWPHPQER